MSHLIKRVTYQFLSENHFKIYVQCIFNFCVVVDVFFHLYRFSMSQFNVSKSYLPFHYNCDIYYKYVLNESGF